ncbi:MAG: aldo/keto reductase [Gammaproteobacteria bacterium]|jgi:aryl-alcohol dehydrogenase-like predicted oxidoreductase|nr:aldo/keto reductase [Gammaproteobacteria bacterium]
MEQRILGKTGFEVSALGFGGGPVGFLATDRQQVAEILNPLLDQGVNLIDTAAGYFGSEEAIGEAVGHRRDDYVLVSKCGQAFKDIDGEAWSAQAIGQTIDRSLERLKTDHIDVMLLHSCDLETLKEGEALGSLIAARGAGKVRFIGYSGDNEAAVYAAGLDDVAVIETSVNICDQANVDAALPEAQRNNVGVLAKRPIANAAWKDASEQQGIYIDYARTYSERLAKMGITPADLGFSGTVGEAWSEIALRFTLSMPGLTTAIVGTTRPSNIKCNLEIAAKGILPEKIVVELRSAFRSAENDAAEPWLAQT